jgi:RNA polymerase II subunit A-like phosphatase
MVCIIDDREDVWNYARNLVHVKPYVWFKDVGDINDINLPSPPIPSEQLIPPISEKEFEEQLENSEHIADERVEMDSNALIERTTEEGFQNAIHRGEKRKLDNDNDINEKLENDEGYKKLKEQNETSPVINDSNIVLDSDIYLRQLEIILKRIHTEFYATYDQWTQDKTRDMPDLKQILPDIRRQVLKDVSLCFSHLMPQGYPLEKHRATIIARAMGASVTQDLQIDDNGNCLTTHVIAGKRTTKVEKAIKYNIHVVIPEWLIDCYEQWERKSEDNYILHQNYDVKKSRLFTKETPRQSKLFINNPQNYDFICSI